MKLYELTEQMQGLLSLDDMGEQTLADTLEGLEGEFNDKAINLVKVSKCINSDVSALDEEIKRLTARKKSIQNRHDALIEYLRFNMEKTGVNKIDCPLFGVSLRKGIDNCIIDDVDEIPSDYKDTVITYKPDKKDIKKAIQAGKEVPGAHLEKGKSSIVIK